MPTKKSNVLIDLNIAMNGGYCGIANENRLMFKMLADINHISLKGMLMPSRVISMLSTYKTYDDPVDRLIQANHFFHHVKNDKPHSINNKFFFKVTNEILNKLNLMSLFFYKNRRHHNLYVMDQALQQTVWRQVFMQTLDAKERERLTSQNFYYTDLSSAHLTYGGYFQKPFQLNTREHDFAFFLEPNMVNVSPNTRKIVRFHDAIPLTEPNFVGKHYAKVRMNALRHDAKQAYFVCNSKPTREVLLSLMPTLEHRSTIVPCAMVTSYSKVNNLAMLKKIMLNRLSSLLLNDTQMQRIINMINEDNNPRYILHLATLDPKKNQANLIKAWEQLNYHYLKNNPIKLVMVSNVGPYTEATQNLMRQHVALGNIVHLQSLSLNEMPYLYSHAEIFVFPSFAEGFGLPPMEAMQCECPTIVSDIPTHRWVMGEASLYCDPYDVQSMAKAMARALVGEQANAIRQTLIQKGLIQVNKYSTAVLTGEWANVLEHLTKLKHGIE